MKIIFFFSLTILFSGFVFAQGEDAGVKKTTTTSKKKPVQSTKQKKSNVSTGSKTTSSKKSNKTQATKALFANLTISVSEPNSEVFLSNSKGNVLERDSILIGEGNTPLVIDELSAGKYSLTVRKYGYFDETREITLTAGKPGTIFVTLRPSGVLVSITSDIPGANIEIENVAEFDSIVENLLLKPGNYRVNIYKDGYKTFAREITLNVGGKETSVEAALEPLEVEDLLNEAANVYRSRNYWETIRIIRQVLAGEPDNPRANILAGYAYYFGGKPSDGIYLLSRGVSFGGSIELPVRIFKKKDGLMLPDGILSIDRRSLQFKCASNPSFNFNLSRDGVIELFEKIDNFGITHINLKAKGDFGGKNDRETILLYPMRALVRASKKELSCGNCENEEAALYEIINRWRTNDWSSLSDRFTAVMPSSLEFRTYENENFSLRAPKNWQILNQTSNIIFAAPVGAFIKIRNANNQDSYNYSRGIEASVQPNPNNLDLNRATKDYLAAMVTGNPYLTLENSSIANLSFGKVLINTYSGISNTSQLTENVSVYTTLTPKGDLFVLVMVVPPGEKEEYQSVFRRILNSIKITP
jgi:hypothetical protein